MRHPAYALIACLALGSFATGIAWSGRAQTAENAADGPAALEARRKGNVVRVYEVQDLMAYVENFNDSPVLGMPNLSYGAGSAGHAFEDPRLVAAEDEARMADLLETEVKAHCGRKADWDGNILEISSHHLRLRVSAPESVQAQVKEFLEAYRAHRLLSVAFQARVLRLPTAEVEKLAEKTHGTLELDAAMVKDLMARAAEKDSGIQVVVSGRYRCLSGQRAYFADSRQSGFVSDVCPVVGSIGITTNEKKTTKETKDGKEIEETTSTHEPQGVKPSATAPRVSMSDIKAGFVCDLDAMVTGDHRHVRATVRCSQAQITDMRRTDPVCGVHPEIPTLSSLHWRTTTPIPNGGAVLLTASSSTGLSGVQANGPATETLLLLQATVVEAGK